jgi:HTH-type transcriptional regulator/antitoxin HigA
MIVELERLSDAWTQIGEVLSVPHTEAEYLRISALLDVVVDEVGEHDSHPLASMMETLGTLVDAYEREHVKELPSSPVAVLRLLMDEHGLNQSDLPEVGSQGVVSEILRGRRQINVRQVRALSERFGVSPAVFIS